MYICEYITSTIITYRYTSPGLPYSTKNDNYYLSGWMLKMSIFLCQQQRRMRFSSWQIFLKRSGKFIQLTFFRLLSDVDQQVVIWFLLIATYTNNFTTKIDWIFCWHSVLFDLVVKCYVYSFLEKITKLCHN